MFFGRLAALDKKTDEFFGDYLINLHFSEKLFSCSLAEFTPSLFSWVKDKQIRPPGVPYVLKISASKIFKLTKILNFSIFATFAKNIRGIGLNVELMLPRGSIIYYIFSVSKL